MLSVRDLQLGDLTEVSNLLSEQLLIRRHRLFTCLVHFLFDIPLRSLGLDSITGSVAQTQEGNIVGVIFARRLPISQNWVIGPLLVDLRYRGLGIGTRIMEHMIKSLRAKRGNWAIVTIDGARRHSNARKLFEGFSFKYLKHFFQNRDHARRYVRMMVLRKSFSEIKESSLQKNYEKSQKTGYVLLKKL